MVESGSRKFREWTCEGGPKQQQASTETLTVMMRAYEVRDTIKVAKQFYLFLYGAGFIFQKEVVLCFSQAFDGVAEIRFY